MITDSIIEFRNAIRFSVADDEWNTLYKEITSAAPAILSLSMSDTNKEVDTLKNKTIDTIVIKLVEMVKKIGIGNLRKVESDLLIDIQIRTILLDAVRNAIKLN